MTKNRSLSAIFLLSLIPSSLLAKSTKQIEIDPRIAESLLEQNIVAPQPIIDGPNGFVLKQYDTSYGSHFAQSNTETYWWVIFEGGIQLNMASYNYSFGGLGIPGTQTYEDSNETKDNKQKLQEKIMWREVEKTSVQLTPAEFKEISLEINAHKASTKKLEAGHWENVNGKKVFVKTNVSNQLNGYYGTWGWIVCPFLYVYERPTSDPIPLFCKESDPKLTSILFRITH